jgi:Ni,Fe-hydrogenase III large subunit
MPHGELMTDQSNTEFSNDSMVVSMTEGWRGEVIHIVMTDSEGKIMKYKIKDPSFNNWFALALAVRNNGVSDFPLCNKSFNLSYCGNDL